VIKIKVWCDSGANIHSCRSATLEPSDWGYTEEEWEDLSEDEKEDLALQWAWERLDIGFRETTENE
jgi:hypothetical protein